MWVQCVVIEEDPSSQRPGHTGFCKPDKEVFKLMGWREEEKEKTKKEESGLMPQYHQLSPP